MENELQIGLTHKFDLTVTTEFVADQYGNAGFPVYATPALVAHVEAAAIQCVAFTLDEGQGTVGTRLDIQHLAATPLGMAVSVQAELSEIDGRRLVFSIEAYDEVEQIAKGTHERFVINSIEKFVARASQKAASGD